MGYRSTPNTAIPNNTLAAEVFLDRCMQIQLGVTYPTVVPVIRNDKMVERFNKHRRAKLRYFDEGNEDHVRDFRPSTKEWTPDVIIVRSSNVIYSVWQGSRIVNRYISHIKTRYDAAVSDQKNGTEYSLEMPLDTFALPVTERKRHPSNQRSYVQVNGNTQWDHGLLSEDILSIHIENHMNQFFRPTEVNGWSAAYHAHAHPGPTQAA